MSTTRTATSTACKTGSTRAHRTLALAGTAMLFGGAALAAAAPAQAAGAVLDPVQVERSCKTPGKSGSPDKAYYSSVVLRGSATGSSTFTFDSLTVQKNAALTQITPKEVTVPAGSTTTVTIQVTGAKNSANGPAVLTSTVTQGGTTSQHTGTITSFAPMQTADCGVSYPSNVNKPWPISGGKVVSVDLDGNPMYVPASVQTGTIAVFAGHNGNQYALKSDGTTAGWNPGGGDITLPADWTNLKSIDGVNGYNLAVNASGTVLGTGDASDPAMTDMVGKTGMKTVSTANTWSIGLTDTGGVVAAGTSDGGPAFVPGGLDHGVVQALAQYQGAMALKDDGTVVRWEQYSGVRPNPADVHNVTEIAADSWGQGFAALRDDGTVIFWNHDKETTAVTAATGATHIAFGTSVAFAQDLVLFVQKQDGTVSAVNITTGISTPVPSMKGATDLKAAVGHGVAIVPGT